MGRSTTLAQWTTLLLEKHLGVQQRWMGWETSCIFNPHLGVTVSLPAPPTLTTAPLSPAPTLILLSQKSAQPDTATPTRKSSSLATATPEVAMELTVWFARLLKALASPPPQNAAPQEGRRSTGTQPTASTGSRTGTGTLLCFKTRVRDQALVPAMCTATSSLTS